MTTPSTGTQSYRRDGYVALPALFYNLISVTPVRDLVNARFIATTTG